MSIGTAVCPVDSCRSKRSVSSAVSAPEGRCRADRPGCRRSAGRPARSLLSRSGPSRSTKRAVCASSIAGAIASDVATMQPTMIVKFCRCASAAMASASVSPPALSSLILTASYFPASAGKRSAVVNALVGADGNGPLHVRQRLIFSVGQRLFDQRNTGFGAGREIGGEIVVVPALIGIDDQRRIWRSGANRGDAMRHHLRRRA